MSQPLVVFDKVEKRFENFVAVKPTSFEIGAGEFLAIMGPFGLRKDHHAAYACRPRSTHGRRNTV